MNSRSGQPRVSDDTVLWSLAGATLALHFLVNGRYGYWIDELYFMACGDHLAWGYVDHPPLIAVVAKVSRWLLGDSLFAIRFFPAVAGALLVYLTGRIARQLGGGRFAQVLAAIAVIVVPVFLAFHNLLTMNAFEPLLWTLCAYAVIVIIKTERQPLWLAVGAIAGVALLNKYSVAFFGACLIAGLLLTPERRLLRSRWSLLGALVAVVILLPNLLWELAWGWPTVELMRNAKLYQYQPVTPGEFLLGQLQIMHPFTLPLWLAGLGFYLFAADGRRFRALGLTFVIFFSVSLLGQAKTYYLAPIYPMLFAAGAVVTERFSQWRAWNWLKPATVVFLLIGGSITVPLVLPVLPIETLPKYLALLKPKEIRPETRKQGEIPQLFADMFAWPETVAAVAKAYEGLAPNEKSRCAIWGGSYGDAGAVDFLGRAFGLPKAISGHQNYYLWGPRDYSGDVMITVNIPGESLQPWFEHVDLAATVSCEHCMPDRTHIPIHVCRGLKKPLKEFWPEVKCWTCDAPAFARHSLGTRDAMR